MDTSTPVEILRRGSMMSIILNRPRALNSLNLEMIRIITEALREAEADGSIRFVLFYGRGERGFCAGGDIRELYNSVLSGDAGTVSAFFEEEYAMDLMIHRFPKPVAVIADGITMGGGLGVAAGADIVVVTERTFMAMPETRIGFIPDVGSTGWMFSKCPPGYPEFLGLTGYEMGGAECVRLGFATHLTDAARIEALIGHFANIEPAPAARRESAQALTQSIAEFTASGVPADPDMDSWVREYFTGKTSLPGIMSELRACGTHHALCEGVFQRLSERSPTALLLTLALLRHNEGRPLEEVFRAEHMAAVYITRHPDYREGVRARIIDRDDNPGWRPSRIEEARLEGFEF